MPNGTYGGVRGRKTKVGRKLLRFPPTRLIYLDVFLKLYKKSLAFSVKFFLLIRIGEGNFKTY